jgi:hypothetical protein
VTKPRQWDPKTWLAIFAFCGFSGVGSFITFGQKVLGWMVAPTVEAFQSRALGRQDSVNARRFDSLAAWRARDRAAIDAVAGKVDTLVATVADMPGAPAAAKRRRVREQAQQSLTGSSALVDDRSRFRALKGEEIP